MSVRVHVRLKAAARMHWRFAALLGPSTTLRDSNAGKGNDNTAQCWCWHRVGLSAACPHRKRLVASSIRAIKCYKEQATVYYSNINIFYTMRRLRCWCNHTLKALQTTGQQKRQTIELHLANRNKNPLKRAHRRKKQVAQMVCKHRNQHLGEQCGCNGFGTGQFGFRVLWLCSSSWDTT